MANPKRRHSKARSRKRRANWKVAGPTLMECPQCREPKVPHRACLNCGYYDGRVVVAGKNEAGS